MEKRKKRKKCRTSKCPLFLGGREVPYDGNTNADVIWFGESPGKTEEEEGKPFVGDAGILSRKVCERAGLPWKSLFIMNSARCRIDKANMTDKEIRAVLDCCRKKVVAAIRAVGPKCIIACGDFALRQLTGRKGITKARGKWIWSDEFNCWIMPTFHPAYILRNRGLLPVLQQDVKAVVSFIKNGYAPVDTEKKRARYVEVQSIRKVLDAGALSVGFDTETQGVDWMDENFVLISYSISFAKGVGCQVFLFEECPIEAADFTIKTKRKDGRKWVEKEIGVRRSRNFDEKVDELWELLERKNIKKYMMNGNFDIHAIEWLAKKIGRPEPVIRGYAMDVQAAANLIDENVFKKPSLEMLQKMLTDYESDYNSEFGQKYEKSDMLSVPREELTKYAVADADVTRRAALKIKKHLSRRGNRRLANYLVRFTMPTLMSLALMERNGAWIDLKQLPKVVEEVNGMMEEQVEKGMAVVPKKVKEAHEERGLRFSRGDFIRDILFSKDGFGLKPVKQSKTGPSVDKEVRTALLEGKLPAKARTFLEAYSQWSILNTLSTRYLSGFEKWVKSDGRIHTKFSLATTVTGRVASTEPNMMNNPKRSKEAKKIRRLIAAPKGRVLLAADASQCLVPETVIFTIDGYKTLDEVIKKKIPVLSVSEDWELSFQRVVRGWCTGKKECVKITLEDGSSVVCSLLHKFRSWDGRWLEAKDIRVGTRLAHVWTWIPREGSVYYPHVGVARKGSRREGTRPVRLHRLVGDFLCGGHVPHGSEVHHKNKDKSDWRRENIEVVDVIEHRKLHAVGSANPNFGNRRGVVKKCPVCGKIFYRPPSRSYEVTCSKSCSNFFFPRRKSKDLMRAGNHVVVKIERVGVRKTYQIEVERNHTYVLGNGVVSKNSELRWMAHVARDPVMIKIFREGKIDIHTATAQALYNGNWDGLDDEKKSSLRRSAKAVNFGLMYGMTVGGFIRYAKLEYGLDLSWNEASSWVTIFFSKYFKIREYHRRIVEFCRRTGYVESPLGRRRRLPEINSENKWLRLEAERQAINHPIQSISSDAVLIALDEIVDKRPFDIEECMPILFVHDELVFESPDDGHVDDRGRIIKEFMENPPMEELFGVKPSVPLVAEVKVGYNLAEMEEMDL